MSDEYVNTVVISDPAYRPGELMPAQPANAPVDEGQNSGGTVTPTHRYPEFDDTSWLT